jgi:tetratricopeptide (TPR) repeat protein
MKFTTTALGLVLVCASVPGFAQLTRSQENDNQKQPAQQQQQGKPGDLKPSSGALKAIVELQNAVNANDVANIPAKLAAAQAAAKTKEDRYLIGVFQRKAALAAKDNVALAAAVQAIEASGGAEASTVAALYADLGIQQFNAKQYPQAVASLQRATTLSPNDAGMLELYAQAKSASGQNAEAAGLFQRAIQMRTAAGQKPSETIYRQAVQAAYDSKAPVAVDLGRQWIAAYPSNDSWKNAILIYRQIATPDVESTLDLLRLMQTVGALSTAGDYSLFASAAADQLNFVEAQSVLDAGIAAGKVDPAGPQFRDLVSGVKAKQKPTAADLAVAMKSAANTKALIRIGDSYAALGDNAKAIEVYRAALKKPDADAAVANIHLGIALARSGDKAGAKAAFEAVTGARAEVAKYWLLYLQTHA